MDLQYRLQNHITNKKVAATLKIMLPESDKTLQTLEKEITVKVVLIYNAD